MRFSHITAATTLAFSLLAMPAHAEPTLADGWTLEPLTGPSPFHGVHGLTVTPEGRLLAGSVVGATLYEIDRKTGAVTVAEAAPDGMADDVEQGPDGTLAWTAFLQGKVFARTPAGELLTLAEGLPGTNSLAWTDDGRLFMTQVFAGDALWELDPTGKEDPRLIMKDMGGLNGFDFGPDGHLYGPIWFKSQIARVNVDAGTLEVIADGFQTPAAVNFNSKNELYAVDTQAGEVIRVDVASGAKTIVAQVKPAIDNLAFAPDDTLYISNMADNAIIEVDVETGESTALVSGPLAVAADIAMGPDGRTLYVADVFAIRAIDTQTGDVTEIARVFAQEMDYPTSMAVAHNKFAVAGLTAGAVQLFDGPTGKSIDLMHGFTTPTEALPLEDGGILVTEYARGAIVRVNPDDHEDRITLADKLDGPAMMQQGPDSAIYFSETKGGRISRLTDSGGVETVVDDLANPEGFTFLANGGMAIVEAAKQQITMIMPEGDRVTIASGLPFGVIPEEGPEVFMPTGVAEDDKGNLYFSSEILAQVFKLSPSNL